MAAYETSAAAPFGAIATFRAVQAAERAISALSRWNDRRITRKSLHKLSDRELDDIGLCRGDIDVMGL